MNGRNVENEYCTEINCESFAGNKNELHWNEATYKRKKLK